MSFFSPAGWTSFLALAGETHFRQRSSPLRLSSFLEHVQSEDSDPVAFLRCHCGP